ncbi:MAG: hypothetical protein BGP06_17310 [Rhizobiales bacterium 65-9]|nr:TerC family protein [Hyphomicrobiales bacterium]OJY38177.1 MAG: hypothetical protein BGP06_17310 [Rhizobiales bacterium 65-9]
MTLSSDLLVSILQIVWIDLLLSGDNAVVIALACRNLPAHQRRLGILLGTGAAIGLRILFAAIIIYLLQVPLLKLVGGLLLLWIAVKLIAGEDDAHGDIAASDSLWSAVRTIAIADAVMSLDNVLAVSAAAHGNLWLFIFGIVLSIPLIVFGSAVVLNLLTRFPILVWAGAALLGWIAGQMITEDPWVVRTIGELTGWKDYLGGALGVLFVLAVGAMVRRRKGDKPAHG